METKSQTKQIMDFLIEGHKITPLEALKKFQCLRLSARIADLKNQGIPVKSQFVEVGQRKKVKEYFI